MLEERGLSRRVAVAVPNFLMALELVGRTELLAVLPKRFVEMHARHFGVAIVALPLPFGIRSIFAATPKVALMDAGLVWLLDAIERAAGAAS
jgi:DNA-binding transcriptional LysR family regulator